MPYLFIVFLKLNKESIAGLLGVSEQHVGVGLEEDGVVDSSIANTQGTLHHDYLYGRRGGEAVVKVVVEVSCRSESQ